MIIIQKVKPSVLSCPISIWNIWWPFWRELYYQHLILTHCLFPSFHYKILLLCRNSFISWKPVLKRLSSVGSKAMPRERTLFVEEGNHLLGTSALYQSAHHTLQKVKVSKLKCQTKNVKWKCEPLFSEEENHLLGPSALYHSTSTYCTSYTAKVWNFICWWCKQLVGPYCTLLTHNIMHKCQSGSVKVKV